MIGKLLGGRARCRCGCERLDTPTGSLLVSAEACLVRVLRAVVLVVRSWGSATGDSIPEPSPTLGANGAALRPWWSEVETVDLSPPVNPGRNLEDLGTLCGDLVDFDPSTATLFSDATFDLPARPQPTLTWIE